MALPLTATGPRSRAGAPSSRSSLSACCIGARCGRRLVASCALQQESSPSSCEPSVPSCSGRQAVAIKSASANRCLHQSTNILEQLNGTLSGASTKELLCAVAVGCTMAGLLWPDAASASEGSLSGGALELFKAFLVSWRSLAPHILPFAASSDSALQT